MWWRRVCIWTCMSQYHQWPSVCPSSLQANFFDEYQMEGVSSEDNEICLEVTPENLSRALKTVQNAKAVKLKLTKKHCPCLTIAAELVRCRQQLTNNWRVTWSQTVLFILPDNIKQVFNLYQYFFEVDHKQQKTLQPLKLTLANTLLF